jgi:hemoglobin-like flavoprotein
MTPRQIELVKTSFAKIAPFKEQASELFYCRLFELDPSLRLMFKSDMTEQKQKVMAALATVVAGLEKLDTMLPTVKELGRKHHHDYGVQKRHYEVVGAALMWTLEIGLGSGWTRELAEAWTTAYKTLAAAMIEGADAPRPRRKSSAAIAA